ncbi:hypothetical protein LEP1GSC047_3141 [Leptospira inadai serovar Lyme str. 10]|uniref:Uncharacterized protein n=2 Tax=Leptospira inadai serovar Lyme TaxID=293084 RepID=V6HUS5_9LEPT|nr:hypothetical protein [Leptospira inadai]EQA36539.1 hypothetical protein LEP1GSC047_3141 [Leptospira inadai serovar Lyme str. 10]PNV74644.1 hypothetical protein BES34_012980 [Leptospira inadai serovar Lyme]
MPYDYEFDEDYDTDGEEDLLDDEAVTYVCEDCDHRWESDPESANDTPESYICAMCGSSNVIEL